MVPIRLYANVIWERYRQRTGNFPLERFRECYLVTFSWLYENVLGTFWERYFVGTFRLVKGQTFFHSTSFKHQGSHSINHTFSPTTVKVQCGKSQL